MCACVCVCVCVCAHACTRVCVSMERKVVIFGRSDMMMKNIWKNVDIRKRQALDSVQNISLIFTKKNFIKLLVVGFDLISER